MFYWALYSVGVCIYVNSFTTVGKPFITHGNSAINGSSQSNPWLFDLRLDNTTPTLYTDIAVGTQAANMTESIVISNNFPIQIWVYVIVVVSSNYVDVYMDGMFNFFVTIEYLKYSYGGNLYHLSHKLH